MASIVKKTYKTKKGEKSKYYIATRDAIGNQHTHGGYNTKSEAKLHLNDYNNYDYNNEHNTIDQVFKPYFEMARNKYAKSTYSKYVMYYNIYFSNIKNLEYKKFNSLSCQKFIDGIEDHSPYVAQTVLKMSKAAVNYAIRHHLVFNNIFNDVDNIKLPKVDINHLSVEELLKVLKITKEFYPKYYTIIYTYIGSGLRGGEIIRLEKSDFNTKENSLRINKQYTLNQTSKPKTETSYRKVYICEDLAEVLKRHIKTLDKDCKLLFPSNNNTCISLNNLRRRIWSKILEKAGITKRVRLHDLRGSYIDMLLSKGASIKYVQNQVGHANANTTLNIYAQNNSDMINFAIQSMNDIFKYENSKCCKNVVNLKEFAQNKKYPLG